MFCKSGSLLKFLCTQIQWMGGHTVLCLYVCLQSLTWPVVIYIDILFLSIVVYYFDQRLPDGMNTDVFVTLTLWPFDDPAGGMDVSQTLLILKSGFHLTLIQLLCLLVLNIVVINHIEVTYIYNTKEHLRIRSLLLYGRSIKVHNDKICKYLVHIWYTLHDCCFLFINRIHLHMWQILLR